MQFISPPFIKKQNYSNSEAIKCLSITHADYFSK